MIKLDENYTIERDSNSWSLIYSEERFSEKKNKTVTSKDEWHYPSLSLCLKKYLDQSLKKCASIDEVIEMISRYDKKVESLKIN